MIMKTSANKKAEEFLSISSKYKLGGLVTESPHPATADLSSLASDNLRKAISVLKELDINTLRVLSEKKEEICYLKDAIRNTLTHGNNIFFCGCGATGRLSLTIETLWRQVHEHDDLTDRVFSFMAGGDVALIRSIENFEDFHQYGAFRYLCTVVHRGRYYLRALGNGRPKLQPKVIQVYLQYRLPRGRILPGWEFRYSVFLQKIDF